MNTEYLEFPDRTSLVVDLADRIGTLLSRGVKDNNTASLVVSGGSTPVQLFERLSGSHVPWSRIVVSLVDERWVDPAGPDSNEHLVRRHLLKNRAAEARFAGMKNAAATAKEGQGQYEGQLREIPRPFDVLILGMGNDGHTASLFPGAPELAAATDMDSGISCMAVTPLNAPHQRLTLTLPAILDSRRIILHITGQSKKDVLEAARADGPAEDMPVRFILRQRTIPVTVFWAP